MNKGEGGDKRWIFKQTRPRPKKGAPKDTHLLVHISEPAQCTIATHIYLEFRSSYCKTQFHATGEGCLFFLNFDTQSFWDGFKNPSHEILPYPQDPNSLSNWQLPSDRILLLIPWSINSESRSMKVAGPNREVRIIFTHTPAPHYLCFLNVPACFAACHRTPFLYSLLLQWYFTLLFNTIVKFCILV